MTNENQLQKKLSEQHMRFLETARALGCDEDEAAFDEKLKGIARQKAKAKPETQPPVKTDRSSE